MDLSTIEKIMLIIGAALIIGSGIFIPIGYVKISKVNQDLVVPLSKSQRIICCILVSFFLFKLGYLFILLSTLSVKEDYKGVFRILDKIDRFTQLLLLPSCALLYLKRK